MSALLRKSIADVTRRKGRSLLAILAIFLGVLGITAVGEASDLISSAFLYTVDPQAVPNAIVVVEKLSPTIASTIQQLPNVEHFQLRPTFNTFWLNTRVATPEGFKVPAIEIDGYRNPGQATSSPLGAWQLTSGHWPGRGEVVMDESDRTLTPLAPGDTVQVLAPSGQHVSLRIVGFARTQGLQIWHPSASAVGYMSVDAMQQPFLQALSPHPNGQYPPRGTEILIKTHDPNNPRRMCEAITQVLAAAHLTASFAQCSFSSANANTQLQIVGLLTVIQLLALLALLLVCVMIFTSISTLLGEQIKIIGTMKALGGTSLRIMSSYLLTLAVYTTIGTALGLVVGLVAGYQLASVVASTVQYSVTSTDVGPFQVSPWVLMVSLVVGLLVPLCCACWPLWIGTRITVREAMAGYDVQAGGRTLTCGWGRQLHQVPQTVWLGMRGVFRKPGRAGLTLLALTLSGAIFLAVQMTNSSLAASVTQGDYQSDFRITLTNNLTTAPSGPVVSALKKLPNVEDAEPIDSLIVTIASRELELDGLPADTHLYQPKVVAGRWLHMDEQNGLVLNDIAAHQLHMQVGNVVTVDTTDNRETEQEQQAHWTIVGIIHDVSQVDPTANPQGRLGVAFTTLGTLNRSLRHLSADAAWRLWLRASNHSPQALRQLNDRLQEVFNQTRVPNAYAQSVQQFQQQQSSVQMTMYILFDTVTILVALIGILSLTLTLATSVLERRLEVGILRSLGATGWRVGTIFCIEGLTLASFAWGLGTLIGLPGGNGILNLLGIYFGPVDASFSPLLILLMLCFILLVACVASFSPALSASRIRIRGTLRYE